MARTLKWFDVYSNPAAMENSASRIAGNCGIVREVQATSKTDAIKQVKKIAENESWYDRHDGRIVWKATETN